MVDGPDNKLAIGAYLHCGLCAEEWKSTPSIKTKMSPSDYQNISAGWTKEGLQLWCNRHDCNIIHIDFEGQQHKANLTRRPTKKEELLK